MASRLYVSCVLETYGRILSLVREAHEPLIGWCASMSDEEWIDRKAANYEDWYKAVERDFGLNTR